MTIGFSSRLAIACAALWAIGVPTAPAQGLAVAEDPAPPSRTASPLYGAGTQVRRGPGAPALPDEVSALSWLVADVDSGVVLAAHDAHRRLPPASTLKALFALTVLPVLPGNVRHTVRESDLAGVEAGSSLVGVTANHTYSAADLWHGVFLNSGNDAVRVLAAMHGGWRTTAAEMQRKARQLGALDTRVVSPDGFDAPGQVSSAYDLALFGRAGLRNADFARYCAKPAAMFPAKGRSYQIQNTNRLLTGADGVKPYPGIVGVKNGYTSGAGNTLIAAARRDGRTLIVTVLNPQTGGGFAVYEEARALLDWGFEAAGRVRAVGSLEPRSTVARPGPTARPAAALPSGNKAPGWPEAGAIAGAAALGAGATGMALRGWKGPRPTRD
ncbi:D-alanyl-D-alanine carboxypeptidase family protein [Streptomyces cavernae]|uniref:D-alanyl-D-alanine carboxypeptidase family protein n=1 Tax=Streptomyces cavernae TaxID=2259034 RepID=UPI000FEB99A7|nr:D-alanyl-D-alanine carboxypeptidase [Streptomyces cavernae]